jgi:hypothetical protein
MSSNIYKNNDFNLTEKDARSVYSITRNYLGAISGMSKRTSVKTGIGQSYPVELARLSKHRKLFRDVANTLRQAGAEEKANNLERLADIIDQSTNEQPNIAAQALKLTDKFKTGGLVQRK